MKFLHSMIRVKDIEKSLHFYTEIMGLKVARTMDLDDCRLYYLKDENDKHEIELTYNFEVPESGYEIGSAFGHFAFETDNMDKFSEILKKNNLEYEYEPFEIKPGLRIAFVQDPDGYSIELIEK